MSNEQYLSQHLLPGAQAPRRGEYEMLDAGGTPTGTYVQVAQGSPLPPAPPHSTWRLHQRAWPVPGMMRG